MFGIWKITVNANSTVMEATLRLHPSFLLAWYIELLAKGKLKGTLHVG